VREHAGPGEPDGPKYRGVTRYGRGETIFMDSCSKMRVGRTATRPAPNGILLVAFLLSALGGCGEERGARTVPATRERSSSTNANGSETTMPPRAIPTH
jgi:hypothetical protein